MSLRARRGVPTLLAFRGLMWCRHYQHQTRSPVQTNIYTAGPPCHSHTHVQDPSKQTTISSMEDFLCACGERVQSLEGCTNHVAFRHSGNVLLCPFNCGYQMRDAKRFRLHCKKAHGIDETELPSDIKERWRQARMTYDAALMVQVRECFVKNNFADEENRLQQTKESLVKVKSDSESTTEHVSQFEAEQLHHLKCIECGIVQDSVVTTKAGRREHVARVHSQSDIQCPFDNCNYRAYKDSNIKIHMTSVHLAKGQKKKMPADVEERWQQASKAFYDKTVGEVRRYFPHPLPFTTFNVNRNVALAEVIATGTVSQNSAYKNNKQQVPIYVKPHSQQAQKSNKTTSKAQAHAGIPFLHAPDIAENNCRLRRPNKTLTAKEQVPDAFEVDITVLIRKNRKTEQKYVHHRLHRKRTATVEKGQEAGPLYYLQCFQCHTVLDCDVTSEVGRMEHVARSHLKCFIECPFADCVDKYHARRASLVLFHCKMKHKVIKEEQMPVDVLQRWQEAQQNFIAAVKPRLKKLFRYPLRPENEDRLSESDDETAVAAGSEKQQASSESSDSGWRRVFLRPLE